MACEEARRDAARALGTYTRIHDKLGPLLEPLIGTLHPAKPIVWGSPEFRRIADLQQKEDEAFKHYRAASAAWMQALRLHR